MGSGTSKEDIGKRLEKLKTALNTENNDLSQLIEQTAQDLKKLTDARLNIAIMGESGAGKSSLVNALREIEDDEEGAAETGVEETTKEPKEYPHPTFRNVTIWDLPGFGAVEFPTKEYQQKVELMKYDFFIIVTSFRFTENDVLLAQEIHKMEKKFYYVRTKLDVDIESEKRKTKGRKESFSEEKILERIKKYCCDNLKKAGVSHSRVFLVSSHYWNRYDFQLLLKTIKEELDEIKRYALIKALSNKSKGILKKKKDAMQALIQDIALVSAASGAPSVPGLYLVCDIPFLESIMCDFSKIFGLDENSLHRLAKQVGKPVDVLCSAIKKTKIASQINGEFVNNLLSRMRETKRIHSGRKMLYYMYKSHRLFGENHEILSLTLQQFLDDAEEDVLSILAKAFEN